MTQGHVGDQRTEELLISRQIHQEPSHRAHIGDAGRTQLIQLAHKWLSGLGRVPAKHRPTLNAEKDFPRLSLSGWSLPHPPRVATAGRGGAPAQ